MDAAARRFDRFSKDYAALNDLQRTIARELMESARFAPKRVMDLGCGDGAIYRQTPRSFEFFAAIDASPSMLALHPSGAGVYKALIDFNDIDALGALAPLAPFDLIASCCALQWAADLDATLKAVAPFGSRVAFAIFTDGALSLLRDLSGAKTPALSFERARDITARYFKARFWRKSYRLEFASKQAMFAYIRKSGIGGGLARLSVGDARRLIAEYPSASLDYETLFAIGDR
ncbi:MAG: methyltransferase domain-containing protein [Helicobacteraceae bacterium]|nr:methyltransferase domain-containing protein [Helicobacteraceae bacterium]